MMISPEAYYEQYLKGKPAEEILSKIRGLKNEIGRLKNIVEHPEYECTTKPSESTRISCTREYLERAKQALADLGVEYQPSKVELKVAKFIENIQYITRVTLSIGGYFYGNDEYKVVLMDNDALFSFGHSDIPSQPDEITVMDINITKEEFLDELRRLHIGEWRKRYDARRYGYEVCDGTQWSLEINYSNGIKPVKIYGDNAYPYNFDDLKALMGCDDLEEVDENE